MDIDIKELKYMDGNELEDGYRLVYKRGDKYLISSYCMSIEGFVMELEDYNPYVLDNKSIEFTTVEDLLKRIAEKYNEEEVFIFKTDGTMISYFNKKEASK